MCRMIFALWYGIKNVLGNLDINEISKYADEKCKGEEMKDKMIASEALYGFAGWLTSREEVITGSANHDAGVWAEAVHEFCMENGLADPRDGWENNLIHPSGECSGVTDCEGNKDV